MNVSDVFEAWRLKHGSNPNWGLAWFLANEVCQRYYSSHRIVPHVIEKEGLGYYGLQFDPFNGYGESIGRMTAHGNVENWRTGRPGDHGLETSEMCAKGLPIKQIVEDAIRHLDVPSVPVATHLNSHHEEREKSYELVFEIATILALRNDKRDGFQIWNHLDSAGRLIKELDPSARAKEHLNSFIFLQRGGKKILITSDARLVGEKEDNFWYRFMNGESAWTLALEIEETIRSSRIGA
jgi:hypothetical protein